MLRNQRGRHGDWLGEIDSRDAIILRRTLRGMRHTGAWGCSVPASQPSAGGSLRVPARQTSASVHSSPHPRYLGRLYSQGRAHGAGVAVAVRVTSAGEPWCALRPLRLATWLSRVSSSAAVEYPNTGEGRTDPARHMSDRLAVLTVADDAATSTAATYLCTPV